MTKTSRVETRIAPNGDPYNVYHEGGKKISSRKMKKSSKHVRVLPQDRNNPKQVPHKAGFTRLKNGQRVVKTVLVPVFKGTDFTLYGGKNYPYMSTTKAQRRQARKMASIDNAIDNASH